MNRRSFLRAATGCAVAGVAAPVIARHAIVMVPPRFTMANGHGVMLSCSLHPVGTPVDEDRDINESSLEYL